MDKSESIVTVDDAIKKLMLLDSRDKIWTQEMLLQVTDKAVRLLDCDTQVYQQLVIITYCNNLLYYSHCHVRQPLIHFQEMCLNVLWTTCRTKYTYIISTVRLQDIKVWLTAAVTLLTLCCASAGRAGELPSSHHPPESDSPESDSLPLSAAAGVSGQ